MLKERHYVFQRVNMAADLGLTALAVVLAHTLRNDLLAPYVAPDLFRDPARLADSLWLLYTMPPIMVAALAWNGYYQSQRIRGLPGMLRAILAASVITTIATMGISFLLSSNRAPEAGVQAFRRSGVQVFRYSGVQGEAKLPESDVEPDSTSGFANGDEQSAPAYPSTQTPEYLNTRTPAASLNARTPERLNASPASPGDTVSRGVLLLVPALLIILLGAKSLVARWLLVLLRRRGLNYRTLLLVGSGDTLRQFIALIHGHTFWGFRIAGIIDDGDRETAPVQAVPVVGGLSTLWTFLETNPIDEVVFIPARRSLEELTPYFEGCEEMGVRTRLALNFFRHTIARPVLDAYEGVPVVTYSPTREISTALLVKYAFDRLAALAALLLLSPLYFLISLIIKLTSQKTSDPIFYAQERVGLHGKPFKLWKFRSMVVDADADLEKLRHLNEMGGPVFKIKRDPRITPIGRFLRKTSLDELPQFWNVLRGEMSLVGPRPPLPREVAKYDRWQRRRLSMKPGLTCLWQVMGRNQLSFDRWMKLDLEYIDNWSLTLDLQILLRTIYVVTTGHGAM